MGLVSIQWWFHRLPSRVWVQLGGIFAPLGCLFICDRHILQMTSRLHAWITTQKADGEGRWGKLPFFGEGEWQTIWALRLHDHTLQKPRKNNAKQGCVSQLCLKQLHLQPGMFMCPKGTQLRGSKPSASIFFCLFFFLAVTFYSESCFCMTIWLNGKSKVDLWFLWICRRQGWNSRQK